MDPKTKIESLSRKQNEKFSQKKQNNLSKVYEGMDLEQLDRFQHLSSERNLINE